MSTLTYSVAGMSCEHCVNTITAEIGKIGSVSEVDVNLDAKTVTVVADPAEDEAIRAAIDDAGYTVVAPL